MKHQIQLNYHLHYHFGFLEKRDLNIEKVDITIFPLLIINRNYADLSKIVLQ